MKCICKTCHKPFESDSDKQIDECFPCRLFLQSRPMGSDSAIFIDVDNTIYAVEPAVYAFSKVVSGLDIKGKRRFSYQAFPIYMNHELYYLTVKLRLTFHVNITEDQTVQLMQDAIRKGVVKVIDENSNRCQVFFCLDSFLKTPIQEPSDTSKICVVLPSKIQSVLKNQKEG